MSLRILPLSSVDADGLAYYQLRDDDSGTVYGHMVATPAVVEVLQVTLDVAHAIDAALHPEFHPEVEL